MNTKIASKLILSTLFGISFLAQPTMAQVPGAGGQANSPPVPRVAQPIVNTYAQFTGGGGHGGGGGGYGGFGGGFGGGGGGGGGGGSYLQGAGSLTNANAQYYFTTQQARLGKEQVENAKIANRRAKFDEDAYEKANTPTRAELDEKDRQEALRLARNNPANGDIWSGKALNTIFNSIQKTEITNRIKGPSMPISEEILRHLNLTTGTAAGSVGIFKGQDLPWPMVLRGPEFKSPRDNINRIAPEAVRQASSGSLEPDTYKKFKDAISSLGEIINNMAADLSPGDFIQSRRFANNLDEGLKNLSEPNAVNHLNGRWSAKGATVGALMDHMTSNGLRFAPAVEGDKPFYSSFYNLLTGYDAGVSQLVGK